MEEVLQIEKIVFGGEGLGRLPNGKVLFVPFVLPGEKVKVRITKEDKDFAEGEPVEILEESPFRTEAKCKYYGICGGCQFQHVVYSEEINLKKEILKEIFARTKIPLEFEIEVIPSPKEYFYRNKLRLHVESPKIRMGFVKRKTHSVIKIEKCLLAEDILNEILEKLYKNPSWERFSPYVKRVRIESSPLEGKGTLLIWSLIPPSEEVLQGILKIKEIKSIFYWVRGSRPKGPFPQEAPFSGRRVFPVFEDLTYYIQPGVFVQSNWDVNLKIINTLLEIPFQAEEIFDAHTGMGNFLIPLAFKNLGKTFLGVDTDLRAIEDGLFIVKKHGLEDRVDLRKISAFEGMYEALKMGESYDLVLLDPPRGGCKEIMRFLPELARKHIVYLSCDAPTLVRDVKILLDKGFRINRVILFDMFPRTYHFETLVWLEKGY